jgi:hypothetical protein
LHSPGKGANKRRRIASLLIFPSSDAAKLPAAGPARAVFSAGGLTGKTDEDRTVTAITAAEPSRRDFLFIATGAAGAVATPGNA